MNWNDDTPARPKLTPTAQELLLWLDAKSGAAHLWVNVDERKHTCSSQVRQLVDAGLAEMQERKVWDGPRVMRITSLGRAMCARPSEEKKGP